MFSCLVQRLLCAKSGHLVLQIFSFMTMVNQQEQEHNLPVNRTLRGVSP